MIGGYDVYIYAEVYEATLNRIYYFDNFEFGYRLVYLVLRIFSDDRHFMFFGIALLFFTGQSYVLKKYSPLFYLSLFIIFCKFFLMSFVYLRQELAMIACWLTIPFVLQKKYIKYFAFMIIAVSLHKSALLFLPFYFVAQIKFTKIQIVLIAFFVLFASLTPLVDQLMIGLGEGEAAESSEAVGKVVRYHARSSGINPFYLIESILLLTILVYFKNNFYRDKQTTVLANGFFIYILVTIFSVKNGAFIRFNWYYLIFVAIALSYFVVYIKGSQVKQLFKFIIILYFSLLFFRLLIKWDFGDLMPYKTIFEEGSRGGMWEWMEYRMVDKKYGI